MTCPEKFAPGPWVHVLDRNMIVRKGMPGVAGSVVLCSVEYLESKAKDRFKWMAESRLPIGVAGMKTVVGMGYSATQAEAMTEALKTAAYAGAEVDMKEVV